MNRKLLVVFLIVLAAAPISTLLATGILLPDAGNSNTVNTTTTLDAATGLTAAVSTIVMPRVHQHYKVDLSVSLGDCINPYGRPC